MLGAAADMLLPREVVLGEDSTWREGWDSHFGAKLNFQVQAGGF
jgi:hypothetical protein